jgi:hypothetical protein
MQMDRLSWLEVSDSATAFFPPVELDFEEDDPDADHEGIKEYRDADYQVKLLVGHFPTTVLSILPVFL